MHSLRKLKWFSILTITTSLVSACGTSNNTGAITPLPTVTATTIVSEDVNTDLPEKQELTATSEPTSILEVTATAFVEDLEEIENS